ncbi:MAG TPA: murein L,D-transpeptidase catalytic domain family protein [Vicinamibacterales bacterium]|nr:murein L,D-transpeptidase catalytic domain family protein [Vicinamibacterales bacterium]
MVCALATCPMVVLNARAPRAASGAFAASNWNHASLGAIDRHVFDLALGAANCAVQSGAVPDPSTLTVIDYSKPSAEKRLWVFDLRSHALLYEELVAHGKGSGDRLATAFSNNPESHQSSLGLFETTDTYSGKNGYSLRLKGLDAGFNDKALERAIVMHGAPYVSEKVAKSLGRVGRSWGCPAVREAVAHDIIDRIRGNGLLFTYYPDQKWLASSRFLGSCSAPTA